MGKEWKENSPWKETGLHTICLNKHVTTMSHARLFCSSNRRTFGRLLFILELSIKRKGVQQMNILEALAKFIKAMEINSTNKRCSAALIWPLKPGNLLVSWGHQARGKQPFWTYCRLSIMYPADPFVLQMLRWRKWRISSLRNLEKAAWLCFSRL